MRETIYAPEFLAELRARTPLAPLVRRWGVQLRQNGRELVGLCPVHQERSPSFTVSEVKGFTHCFGCGWHADAIGLYRRMTGAGFIDAVEALAAEAGMHLPSAAPAAASRPRSKVIVTPVQPLAMAPANLVWSPKAEAIWSRRRPYRGTVVETYLELRDCAMPDDTDIGYLPPTEEHEWPTMVARGTDFLTGAPMSLHFTKLRRDGTGKAPVDKPRLILAGHRKTGGVIRLCDDADVTTGLGLGEGIETCLSVVRSGWAPVWAAIDAGNLGKLPVLPGIEQLTVFADNDPAGIKGAAELVSRWNDAGWAAHSIPAPLRGADWNDARAA